MRHRPLVVALALIATLLPVLPAAAGGPPATWYVDDDGCSDATGDSSVTPYCTIQAAVDASNPGDTVEVAAGTYTSAATAVVDVDWSLTINGAGAGSTIIDGQDSRVGIATTGSISVTVSDLSVTNGSGTTGGGISGAGTVIITDVTISSSTAANGGGIGMFNNSNLTLTNVTFDQNSATSNGGGVYVPGASGTSTLTVTGGSFTQNYAGGSGGALHAGGTATTTVDIDDSTFSDNDAVVNGGAANFSSASLTVTIDGSTFTGNGEDHDGGGDDTDNGGAIAASLTTVTISGSQISGNTADNGGGIYWATGTVNVKNTTVSGNSANTTAGGAYSAGGTIENVTITLNSAGVAEGGLRGTGTTPTVRNTIIAGNSASFSPDCDEFISAGYNLIEDPTGCTINGDATGNVTGIDPNLQALADNGGPTHTHAFAADDPPHEAGNPAVPGSGGNACLVSDQRGVTRADHGRCDIGAYELDTVAPVVTVPDDVTVDASSSSGASVSYGAASAVDVVDGVVAVSCDPVSGSTFVIGETTVTCSATDAAGNEGFASFTVTVIEPASISRLSGVDRFETGEAVVQEFWPGTSGDVIIANGFGFPDALTGSNLYGLDAPLLLVATSSIPAATSSELDRLDPDTIYVLGGEAVVDAGVATALSAWGDVIRLSGSNRYATAVKITQEAFPTGVDTLLIASGVNFPDALAGGAAAAKAGAGLLITAPDSLPGDIATEIERLDPTTIYVLGGSAAVSDTVFAALQGLADTVERVADTNRYTTSVAISEEFFPSATTVLIATGLNFPDALAGTLAAGGEAPVLLVPGTSIPAEVSAEIERLGATTIFVLGGTAVIDATVFAALEALIGL